MKKSLEYVGIAVLAVLAVLFLRAAPQNIDQLSAQEKGNFFSDQSEPQAVTVRRVSQASPFQQSVTQLFPFEHRPQDELQTLRNEYAKIAQGKAALMSLQELKAAVAVEREELSELKAEKELAALVGNLGKLIEKYPQSKAAKQARKLLGKPDPNVEQEVEDSHAGDAVDPGTPKNGR